VGKGVMFLRIRRKGSLAKPQGCPLRAIPTDLELCWPQTLQKY
jgi:hypothetical protein